MATTLKAGSDKIVVVIKKLPQWDFREEHSKTGAVIKEEDLTEADTLILKDIEKKQKALSDFVQIPHPKPTPDGYVRVYYDWSSARAIVTGQVVHVGPHKAWDGMRAMQAPVSVGDWVVMHIDSYDRTLFARHPREDVWYCITESRYVIASVEVK